MRNSPVLEAFSILDPKRAIDSSHKHVPPALPHKSDKLRMTNTHRVHKNLKPLTSVVTVHIATFIGFHWSHKEGLNIGVTMEPQTTDGYSMLIEDSYWKWPI